MGRLSLPVMTLNDVASERRNEISTDSVYRAIDPDELECPFKLWPLLAPLVGYQGD